VTGAEAGFESVLEEGAPCDGAAPNLKAEVAGAETGSAVLN